MRVRSCVCVRACVCERTCACLRTDVLACVCACACVRARVRAFHNKTNVACMFTLLIDDVLPVPFRGT